MTVPHSESSGFFMFSPQLEILNELLTILVRQSAASIFKMLWSRKPPPRFILQAAC
jgi:hypothetical protein